MTRPLSVDTGERAMARLESGESTRAAANA
jgi:hypothetical protein